ncbi:MAG TPA: sodium-dependent transporter, partial [Methanocorpusculum sp.]|nr:sodium-dependent transporter [Methanocorpusculum sp.]
FVFSGGTPEALGAGPGLMFIQLPQVFDTMALGWLIGSVFFICVFFAALTSAISLFEVPVAALMDKFKMKRTSAVGIVLLGELIVGVIVNLGYGAWADFTIFGLQILDFMDALSNNILMPILALLTCIFVGWIVKGRTKIVKEEISEYGHKFKAEKFYNIMVKFIAPICIVLIFIYMVYGLL